MKKLALLFPIVFFAFIVATSAQSSASSDEQSSVTEKVKCDDGAKAKGCCAYSTKHCKAGSKACCSKNKSEAKQSTSSSSSKSQAVVSNRETAVEAEGETK